MSEASLLLAGVAVIGACLLATTVAALSTMRELRATMRDARRSLRETQELLARWNALARRVEVVVGSACGVASDALGELVHWKARAERLFTGLLAKGGGAQPRRHGRVTRGGGRR